MDFCFTEIEFEAIGAAIFGHETEHFGQNFGTDRMNSDIVREGVHGGVWSGGENFLQVVEERVNV